MVVLVIIPVDKARAAKIADVSWRFAKLVGVVVVALEILCGGKLLVTQQAKFRCIFHVDSSSSLLSLSSTQQTPDFISSLLSHLKGNAGRPVRPAVTLRRPVVG